MAISAKTTGKSLSVKTRSEGVTPNQRFIGKKVLVALGMVTETPQFLEKEGYTRGRNHEVTVTILTRNLS